MHIHMRNQSLPFPGQLDLILKQVLKFLLMDMDSPSRNIGQCDNWSTMRDQT